MQNLNQLKTMNCMTNSTQQYNLCDDCIYLRENPTRCLKDSTRELNTNTQFCKDFKENW